MGFLVNVSRASEIAEVLRGSGRLINSIEDNDPQYRVVLDLAETIGCPATALVIVGNALISYQLTSRGETFWKMFGEWMRSRRGSARYYLLQTHISFLKETPYNRIGVRVKERRLRLYYNSRIAEELMGNPLSYCGRLDELVRGLASIFRADPTAKTMVFAGKMYYYVCRACGGKVKGDIPIPVDRRIAYLTLTSCLVYGCHDTLRNCAAQLMKPKNRGKVIEAWRLVSVASRIPSYRLDSLLWVIGRFVREEYSVDEIMNHILSYYPSLSQYRDLLGRIIAELTRCSRSST
jgi:DNA-(apurinic or apyrimidinic site) lyase